MVFGEWPAPKAGIPPGKSDASGGIGPKHIVTLTSGFSARCRPMRPIFPVEFQLKIVVAILLATGFGAILHIPTVAASCNFQFNI